MGQSRALKRKAQNRHSKQQPPCLLLPPSAEKSSTPCINLTSLRLYGYSTFLPTIINGLGKWTTAQVQALTIPCYCLGAVSYIVVAQLSDSQQKRGLYSVMFGVISVIGYGVLLSDSSNGVRFFGFFLVALGLYVVVGLPVAWLPANNPRYGKRTTATGLQLTFGNASGIMSPFCMSPNSWVSLNKR